LVPGALFPLPPPDGLPVVLGLPPAPVTPPLLPFPPPPPFEPPLLAVNICPLILVYCKKGAFCAFMAYTVLMAKSCIQKIHQMLGIMMVKALNVRSESRKRNEAGS
jgi:hypothetical protein